MFFKKKQDQNKNKDLTKVAALLIHAARIDECYTLEEEKIIKETILKMGTKEEDVLKIITEAKIIEENTNQILEFTKEVKNMDHNNKIKIIETLWKIIYSNKDADMYETSLMRRIAGLLYIDNKTMGDIKERIKKT